MTTSRLATLIRDGAALGLLLAWLIVTVLA